ncbi:MAG: hypothetical protein WA837_09755 [Xanthobacteraceae bacterium]
MSMSIPHPIPWFFLLAIVVVAKLAVLVLLCRRLRQAFPSVWNDLGRPFSFERYMPSTSLSQGLTEQNAQWSLLFYIFSGQYRDLHDRTVALLVWCARLACVLIAVLLVLALSEGWPQPLRYKWGS